MREGTGTGGERKGKGDERRGREGEREGRGLDENEIGSWTPPDFQMD